MCKSLQAIVLCGSLAVANGAAGQGCVPFWTVTGYQRPVRIEWSPTEGRGIVHDDGSGMAIFAVEGPIGVATERWVVRWKGREWERLGVGAPAFDGMGSPRILDDGRGPRLYVQARPVGSSSSPMWMWDGLAWNLTPSNFFPTSGTSLNAIPQCSYDDGTGMAVYGSRYGSVKRWNGTIWDTIGVADTEFGINMEVFDLGDGPKIYAAGQFNSINGETTPGAATWDGHSWGSLGSGIICGAITDMEVFDSGNGKELYVAGVITSAGGASVQGLAKWNGTSWSGVQGHGGADTRFLCVFDDGSGPALYISGSFNHVGGVPARYVAKFDGSNWHAVAPGALGYSPMAVYDDGRGPSLFHSGNLNGVGGLPQAGMKQLVSCPNCYADCDNNQRLDVNDFMCFVTKYAQKDPYANCDVGAVVDPSDFMCFLAKYAAGCP
ncbi:MAG: hypothetical protein ACKVW3_12575 [Phycisphaerales bacterium]